ncbi:hypothetical protein A3Q56_07237 [Intoshia linei]|uniref:Tubulin--tyrosine ligase-like protein 9 n=1 Tax=Intoshia linei TaxID=1819745 RepID=A0A177ASQ9_9BILA|nr:hypothetical protein A3Q56_07237 [Intoshia linei]
MSKSELDKNLKLKFYSEFYVKILTKNLYHRNWTEGNFDASTPFLWLSPQTVRLMFTFSAPEKRLGEYQIINHFPNSYELTRKDLMARNVKRFLKQCKKSLEFNEYHNVDIIPSTYILPCDYNILCEKHKSHPEWTWIMKPCAKSRGNGIFLINKMSQIKRWSPNKNNNSYIKNGNGNVIENYVITKYIDKPLLVGGKKFDLRIYVLVTSFKPLKVFVSNLGFARFSTVKYKSGNADMDNMFIHLTNVAIQKNAEYYNKFHGGKWDLNKFKFYIENTKGLDIANGLFNCIYGIIIQSLLSVNKIVIQDKRCFELLGYDIIVDDELKPWLIEINSSPSLITTTEWDNEIKTKLISDVIDIILAEKCFKWIPKKLKTLKLEKTSFKILYDKIDNTKLTKRDETETRTKRGFTKFQFDDVWK